MSKPPILFLAILGTAGLFTGFAARRVSSGTPAGVASRDAVLSEVGSQERTGSAKTPDELVKSALPAIPVSHSADTVESLPAETQVHVKNLGKQSTSR